MLQVEDEPGLLSTVSEHQLQNLEQTFLQFIRRSRSTESHTLTLSVQVLSTTGDVSAMIEKIEQQSGSQISQNIRQGVKY